LELHDGRGKQGKYEILFGKGLNETEGIVWDSDKRSECAGRKVVPIGLEAAAGRKKYVWRRMGMFGNLLYGIKTRDVVN